MISITMKPQSRQVIAQLDRMPKTAMTGLFNALQDIGSEFVREEVRLQKLRNKTGRIYGGIRASAPGEVPQKRTGRLARSTDSRTHSPIYMTFGQEVDYAKFLAEGTRRMAPRANLKKAVSNKIILAGKIIEQHVNRETGLDNT